MRMRPWREVADPLAGASIGLVLLMWVHYVWERSTGFTFAQRRMPSVPSTPAHLAHTLNFAIGVTVLFLPPRPRLLHAPSEEVVRQITVMIRMSLLVIRLSRLVIRVSRLVICVSRLVISMSRLVICGVSARHMHVIARRIHVIAGDIDDWGGSRACGENFHFCHDRIARV